MSNTTYKLYTKKGCGFCVKAKELLREKELEFEEFSLEKPELMESFKSKFPTAKTVPQITKINDGNEEYIGGYTELAQSLTPLR